MASRVTGALGQRDIGKEGSRYYFGLKSSLFTVRLETKQETETVEYTNSERNGALGVLGAERIGTLYQRPAGDATELRLLSYTYQLPARFVFTGRGNGHGVGMSQWGAQGMALAGATAAQILTHYYTGISLTQVGGD
jgi:SpoIID/LytB domain protein